jgi:hypothetical protein
VIVSERTRGHAPDIVKRQAAVFDVVGRLELQNFQSMQCGT